MSRSERLKWGLMIVFALVIGYFTYREMRHAAEIWSGLMPVALFFNERLPPSPQRRTLQTTLTLGFMAVVYLLLRG